MTLSLYELLIKENPSTEKRFYTFRLNDYNKKLDIFLCDKDSPPKRLEPNRLTSEYLETITKEEFTDGSIKCDCRQYADGDFKINFLPQRTDDYSQSYRDHYMRLSEQLSKLSIILHTGNRPGVKLSNKQREHYHNLIIKLVNGYIAVGQERKSKKKV
jgi:hypothetical protein